MENRCISHNHLEIAADTWSQSHAMYKIITPTTAGAATAVESANTRHTDCRLVTEAARCFAIHEDR